HTRFSRDWSSDVCSSDLLSVDGAGSLRLAGVVDSTEILGAETLVTLHAADGQSLVARLPGIVRLDKGSPVQLTTDPSHLRFFDRSEERRGGKEWRCRADG